VYTEASWVVFRCGLPSGSRAQNFVIAVENPTRGSALLIFEELETVVVISASDLNNSIKY
jgi:hypothetical protein